MDVIKLYFWQVSVAVLLDNFVAATARIENEEKLGKVKERKKLNHFKSPLEPLIAKLANGYTDDLDLSSQLKSLFEVANKSFLLVLLIHLLLTLINCCFMAGFDLVIAK